MNSNISNMYSQKFMAKALILAKLALKYGEVPIGALIVKNNQIVSSSYNSSIKDHDPCAHAEIKVIRKAAKRLKTARLDGCHIFVTLEPCPMCAQAISHARLDILYFGAYDYKGGGVNNGAQIFDQFSCFHKPQIYGGILEDACKQIIKNFFKDLR